MVFVFVIHIDNLFELVCLLFIFYLQEQWRTSVSVANAPCLRMMTTLHAHSVGWWLANVTLTFRTPELWGTDVQSMGKASEVLGRRQSEGQPARETALDCLPSTRNVDFVQTSFSLRNLFPGQWRRF